MAFLTNHLHICKTSRSFSADVFVHNFISFNYVIALENEILNITHADLGRDFLKIRQWFYF